MGTMKSFRGFTLIEFLMTLAIAGILFGVAITVLPGRGAAVDQAARGLSEQFTRARLEALKNNESAGVVLSTTGQGSYSVCVSANLTCASGRTVQQIVFGGASFPRVKLATTTPSSFTSYWFDSRGIPRSAGGSITLTDSAGNNKRVVVVSNAGRAAVQ